MNRVSSQGSTWHDPHNNGTYSLISADTPKLQLSRLTGDRKYTDKMTLTLAEKDDQCMIEGCSESQSPSIADF